MDEPVIPPQQLPNPEKLSADGTLTRKQKRYIAGGVMVALSILVVASIAHKPDVPKAKPQPKPVQVLQTMPTAPVVAPPAASGVPMDPMAQTQPAAPNAYPGGSYASPDAQKPEKSLKEQLREEREQLEAKSAFDDNLVSSSREGKEREVDPRAVANTEPGAGVQTNPPVSEVAKKTTKLDFDPNQPLLTLPEGTIINCALVNELQGEFTGPVIAQVSTDVYAPESRTVVIPQGTRVIGEASKVGGLDQQRLAVVFHRMLIPTLSRPYSVEINEKTPGLDQVGATALHDKVNNHLLSTFLAAGAVGAIGGLAQIGNNYGANGYNSMGQFQNGVSQSMAQSSARILERFLNKMPTITIRPGTRVIVFLTQDLEVPPYAVEHP